MTIYCVLGKQDNVINNKYCSGNSQYDKKYNISPSDGLFIKVGYSNSLNNRLAQLRKTRITNPSLRYYGNIYLLIEAEGDEKLESKIFCELRKQNIFPVVGKREWFYIQHFTAVLTVIIECCGIVNLKPNIFHFGKEQFMNWELEWKINALLSKKHLLDFKYFINQKIEIFDLFDTHPNMLAVNIFQQNLNNLSIYRKHKLVG